MAPESSTLKKGSRVVVITDIPGVAAGTTGRVGRAIGVKTTRYRVKFDNGVDALSVAEGKLVSPAAWEFLKQSQTDSGSKITHVTVSAAVPVGTAVGTSPKLEAPPVAQAPPKETPPPPAPAKSQSRRPLVTAVPQVTIRVLRRSPPNRARLEGLWALTSMLKTALHPSRNPKCNKNRRKSRLRVKRRWRAAQQP